MKGIHVMYLEIKVEVLAPIISYVCGQALAHNVFAQSWVTQSVTVALSASGTAAPSVRTLRPG